MERHDKLQKNQMSEPVLPINSSPITIVQLCQENILLIISQ